MRLGLFRALAALGLALSVSVWADENLSPDLRGAQASCSHWQAAASDWPAPAAGQRGVLLYLWSPRMVLSVQHAAQVRQIAVAAGLRWQAARDPRVPADEGAAALASASAVVQAALQGSPPLCDAALLAQGQSLRHFPTAWLWRLDAQTAWQQQGRPIVGAMPPAFWQQALAERLQGLKP
jgi:hypothetical protein